MAGRGPLNYTTVIDPMKSAGECIAMLARHGASAVGMTYDQGKPTGLSFQIETAHGQRQYSLPVNVAGTYKALQKAYSRGDIPMSRVNTDQAERTSWRVLKDWLEAQLALIQAGVAEMDQVLLPYMNIEPGVTVYEAFLDNEQRLAIGRAE